MNQKISYPKEPDTFFKETKKRVEAYFASKEISKKGDQAIVQKYIILKLLAILVYSMIYMAPYTAMVFLAYAILGPLSIILAINIAHDAVHGVAHSSASWNRYFTLQMDLVGANSYVWKRRHQYGHHSFPNTLEKDPDLTQSEVVKILPEAVHRPYHRYQHIYVPFLYAMYTINWIYIRDFVDFFSRKSEIRNIPREEYVKMIFFKILYISLLGVIPVLLTPLSLGQVFLANIVLHVSASYFLTIALVPSHVSEHSIFVTPDADGKMPYSWSHHQVKTTTDFATESKIVTWIFGGFNHHVCHHLFPKISHVHYPALTPIIKEMTEKYGLEYMHEDSLMSAYFSHFNLLRNNGKQLSADF